MNGEWERSVLFELFEKKGTSMKFENIIIMKYGVHAKEAVCSIIERKQEEYHKTGQMFWGYNGVLCNPQTQV